MESNNKRIAKNTVLLYVRMFFIMLVSLYTSRVILDVLGVDDYGIYQSVCGIVGFLSFLNGALGTGTSRFLTFELGTGNFEKLKKTFSTTISVHLILGLIILLVAETGGLWFVYNKLQIPAERFEDAVFAFHFSILTAICSILIVPFNAAIIAHERMSFFAYIGIAEVVCKLGVVYMLAIGNIDKLRLYSILLFVVQTIILLLYIFYCRKNIPESKAKPSIDKSIFKDIMSFSGWSLFSGGSIALNNQGIIVLLNMFFTPAIVVSRTISIQVNSATTQFVTNFRTAVNPQIVKKYAAKDYEGSASLLLESTKFSYYLTFILSLPLYFLAYPILNLWLGQVPEYCEAFLKIILIQGLFQVFDTSLYVALYAKGQLKENALISPTLGLLTFPIVYVLFRLGYSPLAMSWAFVIYNALLALLVKPALLVKIVNYSWKSIFSMFITCGLVTIVSLPIPIILSLLLDTSNNLLHAIIMLVVSILTVLLAVWFVGLTKNQKNELISYLKRIVTKK